MIKIFETDAKSKRSPKRANKKNKPDLKALDAIGNEKLNRLDPMIIPLISVVLSKNPNNNWLAQAQSLIHNAPHRLSDRMIESLNKWSSSQCHAMSLDPPQHLSVGVRGFVGPVTVTKIIDPKQNSEFPTPAIMAEDKNGWKYYFKTSKAYGFEPGMEITFSAILSDHGEGISFFKRPTKIQKFKLFESTDIF